MPFTLWTFLILLVATAGYVLQWYVTPASDVLWLSIWIGVHAFVSLTFLTVLPDRFKDAITNKLRHNDKDGILSTEVTTYAFRVYSLVILAVFVVGVFVFRQGAVHQYTEPAYVIAPGTTLWMLWSIFEVLIERMKYDEVHSVNDTTHEASPLVAP